MSHRIPNFDMGHFARKYIGAYHYFPKDAEGKFKFDGVKYQNARELLRKANKEYRRQSSDIPLEVKYSGIDSNEKAAIEIVNNVQAKDQEKIFDNKNPGDGSYVDNLKKMNKSNLMAIAYHVPKGAQLHSHFTSAAGVMVTQNLDHCRNNEYIWIKSTHNLLTKENRDICELEFNLLPIDADRPEGNLFSESYDIEFSKSYKPELRGAKQNTKGEWMQYIKFLDEFKKYVTLPADKPSDKSYVMAENWIWEKYQIDAKELKKCTSCADRWALFNVQTQLAAGLLRSEKPYREYVRAMLTANHDNGYDHLELRPCFMPKNALVREDGTPWYKEKDGKIMVNEKGEKIKTGNETIMNIIQDELKKWNLANRQNTRKMTVGIIYCFPRSMSAPEPLREAMAECIKLKQEFGHLICGFDLIGEEDKGKTLYHWREELVRFQYDCGKEKVEIPFLFHCGETKKRTRESKLEDEEYTTYEDTEGNILDALLLGTKRIGHGWILHENPLLMKIYAERKIAIECPLISNEILGLTENASGHQIYKFLEYGLMAVVCNDNPNLTKSDPGSHDYLQFLYGNPKMNLAAWKRNGEMSIEASCLDDTGKTKLLIHFRHRWTEFCWWIISNYRKMLGGARSQSVGPGRARSSSRGGREDTRHSNRESKGVLLQKLKVGKYREKPRNKEMSPGEKSSHHTKREHGTHGTHGITTGSRGRDENRGRTNIATGSELRVRSEVRSHRPRGRPREPRQLLTDFLEHPAGHY